MSRPSNNLRILGVVGGIVLSALTIGAIGQTIPAGGIVPLASSSVPGKMKCDGVTTTCAADGTVTATAGGSAGINQLTGDVTAGPASGSAASTLATVNGGSGVVGSSTAIPVLTTNAKGLVTAQTTAVVVAPAGTLTGTTLAAGVTASSLTSTGTLVGGATGAGFTVNLTTSTISGLLAVANGGTGTASPGLVAGTNVTITGTWPNQTINSSAGGMGTGCNPGGVATNLLTDDGAGACTSNAGAKYTAGNLTLGTAGSLVGSVTYANATSGTAKVHPPTGALGTADYTLPAAGTRVIVATDTTDTLTNKTINGANNTITARIANDVSGLGTGIATALGVNVGSAGAPVLFNGAGGTPSSLALANATGLPISTGVSGLGTGVATALGNNLSAAGGVTTTIASGTSAMGTGAISSATCATVVTTAATNTATTDVVLASFNGDPTAVTGYVPATTGMLTIISYPTANNVNFKVCNNTGGSITPGALTLNWRVVR